MRTLRNAGLVMGVAFLAAWPAASQMGGMGMRQPDFRGVWNPVVGSGAAYEVDSKSGKNEIELTVVGKEDSNGKPGYWVEMGTTAPNGGGQIYVKNLMVIDGKNSSIARMVVQAPGRGPMEMPGMMMGRGGQTPPATDVRDTAEKVGSESVTTPAGTFDCEHYRSKNENGTTDVWLSTKVTPWGLVKSTSSDTTMTLVRVISDATDHITGTPMQLDPSMMGRGRGGQPQ